MGAIIVSKEFGISNEQIQTVLKRFNGVEHRIEHVRNLDGVEYYNDSKSTNVKSTQIALHTFTKPTIILLGGLDRGHSFEGLTDYMEHVKKIVCYGETKERIVEYAKQIGKECVMVNTLEEALIEAKKSAKSGDVVLLSPACASWDQYKCFEDRGDEFKRIVNNF